MAKNNFVGKGLLHHIIVYNIMYINNAFIINGSQCRSLRKEPLLLIQSQELIQTMKRCFLQPCASWIGSVQPAFLQLP